MKLFIAGGGTGGHITPGLAVARYVERQQPNSEIRFIGSVRGIENKLIPREGYPLERLDIIGLSRSISPVGIVQNIKAARLTAASIRQCKALLKKHRPDLVLGCGGYASFAMVYAAQRLGVPTVLLEVNALPGKVTKWLCKKADRVLVCFERAKELLPPSDRVVLTGSPVRQEILQADRQSARAKMGLSPEDKLVVSFWGSLGAHYMNEHMAGMIALECQNHAGWHHIHATGAAAKDWLPELVQKQGGNLANQDKITLCEYIYDMADKMAAADLVVCRAGAATLGEICTLGKASLLVPSPFVAENHQEKNARAIEQAGGCRVLLEKDTTPQVLYRQIEQLLREPALLDEMGKNARRLAPQDAEQKIYREMMAVVTG